MTLRSLMLLMAVFTGFSSRCEGQSVIDQLSFANARGGFQFYGISAFTGYSTSAYPLSTTSQQAIQAGAGNIRSTTNYGAGTGLGWRHSRGDRTSISANYRLTFNGNTRYSGLNSFNHVAALNASHRFGSKFNLTLSASGSQTSLVYVLQQPSSLGAVSQLPLTINDLAAASSVGQFSNVQTSSMVAGAAISGVSPVRTVLLGDRVLSYTANVSATYSVSQRLQVYFGSFAAAGQNRSGSGQNYIMPRSIGINGGVGFSYSLSPRTSAGMSLAVNRTTNAYQSAVSSNLSANFGRRMGLHWFLSAHGGYSYTYFTQQLFALAKTRLMVGGGSIGYKFRAQTVVASYNRSASDAYGYSTGVATIGSMGWNWRRPGARWGITASGSQQHSGQNGFSTIDGYHGTGGFNFVPSSQVMMSLSYGYSHSTGTFLGQQLGSSAFVSQTNRIKVQSLRLTVSWNPHGRMMGGADMPGQMGSRTDMGGLDR